MGVCLGPDGVSNPSLALGLLAKYQRCRVLMSVLPKDHLKSLCMAYPFNGMCNKLLIEQSIIFIKSSGLGLGLGLG